MFSAMPLPVYRDDDAAPTLPTFSSASTSSPYRPTRSSPLSSSPIRFSSGSPPLSPRHPNIQRDVQSSPIPAPSSQHTAFSKFAARPTRPNPVTQKREIAQESRRKLFLKNVRQRAEDKRFERRGGEQEWLKLEWFSRDRDIRLAKNADLDGIILDSDIEDAARIREEAMHRSRALGMIPEASTSQENGFNVGMEADDMLVDMFEQEQQAELDAMAEAMSSSERPLDSSQHWSDDEDYDALFMDYLAQEQQEAPVYSQDVESGEMDLS